MGLLFLAKWRSPFRSAVDLSLLAFFLANVAAQFAAVNSRGNLLNTAFLAAGFMVYLVVRSHRQGAAGVRAFLWMQIVGALTIAFIGLASYVGALSAFEDALFGRRLASTFQYPNSVAAYLLLNLVLAWGLLAEARTWPLRAGMAAFSTIIAVAFLLTLSRGAYLLFPFAFLLFLVGIPAGARVRAFLDLVLIALAAAVTVRLLPVPGGGPGDLVYILAAALAGGLASAIIGLIGTRIAVARLALAFILVAVFPAAVWLHADGTVAVSALMPESVLARLRDVNLETTSAAQRLIYGRDALRIIRDHPVFGVGGGGWASLHHRYQDYYYIARQTHSHYLQVAVESGLVGLAAFLAFIALLFHQAYRAWRGAQDPGPRILIWSIICAVVVLLLHSVIDFDLSFGALQLIFWAMAGLISGMVVPHEGGPPRAADGRRRSGRRAGPRLLPRLEMAVVVLIALAVTGFGGSVYAGHVLSERAERQAQEGHVEEAVASLERAARFDPLNPRLHFDMARLTMEGEPERALAYARRAVALDPYRPEWNMILAEGLLRAGSYEEAVDQAERTVSLAPYKPQLYAPLADAYLGLALSILNSNGGPNKVAELVDRALAIEGEILARQGRLAAVPANLATQYPQVGLNPELHYHLGRAHYLRGEWAEAERHLRQASAELAWRVAADRWLYATYHKSGNAAAVEAYRMRPWLRLFGGTPEFKAMLEYPDLVNLGR